MSAAGGAVRILPPLGITLRSIRLLNSLVQKKRLDQMFVDSADGVTFYPYGLNNSGVELQADEGLVVRHNLYLLNLLPYATTVPLLLLVVVAQTTIFRAILDATGIVITLLFAIVLGCVVGAGALLKYAYIAVITSGKPRTPPNRRAYDPATKDRDGNAE